MRYPCVFRIFLLFSLCFFIFSSFNLAFSPTTLSIFLLFLPFQYQNSSIHFYSPKNFFVLLLSPSPPTIFFQEGSKDKNQNKTEKNFGETSLAFFNLSGEHWCFEYYFFDTFALCVFSSLQLKNHRCENQKGKKLIIKIKKTQCVNILETEF